MRERTEERVVNSITSGYNAIMYIRIILCILLGAFLIFANVIQQIRNNWTSDNTCFALGFLLICYGIYKIDKAKRTAKKAKEKAQATFIDAEAKADLNMSKINDEMYASQNINKKMHTPISELTEEHGRVMWFVILLTSLAITLIFIPAILIVLVSIFGLIKACVTRSQYFDCCILEDDEIYSITPYFKNKSQRARAAEIRHTLARMDSINQVRTLDCELHIRKIADIENIIKETEKVLSSVVRSLMKTKILLNMVNSLLLITILITKS